MIFKRYMRYLSINIYIIVIYIMKIDRETTIKLIRQRIIDLDIKNCKPMLETYTTQQLIKVCEIYGIIPYYHE